MRTPPKNRLDLKESIFGRLTVVEEVEGRSGHRYWRCVCSCGNTAIVSQSNLRSGKTASCGCIHRETAGSHLATHGLSHLPEYQVWKAMKARCFNPKAKRYSEYGGRGISVCGEWVDNFAAFFADMGPRPSKSHSIDRIDVDRGYEPANCRWALIDTQSRNRRTNNKLTVNGETRCVSDWAKQVGVSPGTIRHRIKSLGWTDEQAVLTPVRSKPE